MAPVSFTARLAPKKIPNAVQICQHITRPPRMEAGAFSAQKIGTVEALEPIPIPRRKHVIRSSHEVWVTAEPMTERQQNLAEKKMVPRLPQYFFKGSDIQQPRKEEAIYGPEFTKPTSH
jgi:hypothetical protein